MELSRDTLLALAALARLQLTNDETPAYQTALGEILAHVERLQGYVADTTVAVDRRVVTNSAELRSDNPTPPLDAASRAAFLDPARLHPSGALVVPSVFEDRA